MTLLQAGLQWTLTAVPYGTADARALTRALHQEQLATYGTADDPEATENAEFHAPNGLFLVARLGDGPALACGGWRTLNASAAEIKRMYVAPPARGQGLGRRILAALEQDVLGRGPTEILLETGIHNVAALGLYTACGYEPIHSYVPGRNPDINRALRKDIRQQQVSREQVDSPVPPGSRLAEAPSSDQRTPHG
ncbi:GNAT family N-acetyltransferase [Streptomyces sp. OfavH-34-F]|uniref:GNAT family N-acetyltransferase n=1 Tax=Streptomyces sp. OfavH-34-F TaxID=2917760 RepID=UPI001EF21F9A|nr:GNAT family N-acetyltransferase [Streptomyces sp. OfavH-34-F]MCG7522958.1 GNAT family N-acetyltransferase [Streptomyces sp. OfavH-34-F]